MGIWRSVLIASVWVLGLFNFTLAGAAPPVQCPPTCASGPPYSEANFFGTINASYLELSPPYVLNLFSYSDSLGAGQAAADPTSGFLRAYAIASAGNPQFTTIATVDDEFTLHSSSLSGPVTVTVTLSGSGTGLIPTGGDTLQTMVFFAGDTSNFDKQFFQAGTNPPPGTTFPITLSANASLTETIGVPFSLSYSLRIDADDGSSGSFLSTTTNLVFSLPAGVTISSLGGFGVPDTDGDGSPDSMDNCPFTPNGPALGTCLGSTSQGQAQCFTNADCTSGKCSLGQEDTVGNGIGDACRCGDVNNDGIVNASDKTILSRSLAGLAPYPTLGSMPGYQKCDVNGDGLCNAADKTIISRAIAGLGPGIQQACPAAVCHSPEVMSGVTCPVLP